MSVSSNKPNLFQSMGLGGCSACFAVNFTHRKWTEIEFISSAFGILSLYPIDFASSSRNSLKCHSQRRTNWINTRITRQLFGFESNRNCQDPYAGLWTRSWSNRFLSVCERRSCVLLERIGICLGQRNFLHKYQTWWWVDLKTTFAVPSCFPIDWNPANLITGDDTTGGLRWGGFLSSVA